MTRRPTMSPPLPAGSAGSAGPAALSAAVVAALLVAAAVPAGALGIFKGEGGELKVGDEVEIRGIVSAAEGKALAEVEVVLEASRSYFSLRRMGKKEAGTRQRRTTTDERGEFTLKWSWDPYFNHFEIGVAAPFRQGGEEQPPLVEGLDISRRMAGGGPVVASIVVEDTGALDLQRRFFDHLETEEQRRVYRELGRPDEVRVFRYPDRVETSWWYFARGKMVRFSDGELEKVVPFDPVRGF